MDSLIANKRGNKTCIICSGKNPTWGCFPYGVLCCTKCSGAFRGLGTSVCVVKSLLLDSVSEAFLESFRAGGNSAFLAWYSSVSLEELTPDFFRTQEVKKYAHLLEEGKIKDPDTKAAPVAFTAMPVMTRSKSKFQMASLENSSEEEPEEQEPRKEQEHAVDAPYSFPAAEEKPKAGIRRVPGKISTDSRDASRLGMFRNLEQKSPVLAKPAKTYSYTGSDLHSHSTEQPIEIVRGHGFIGSADKPVESVGDKIKKGLEKGKKTLFRTFKGKKEIG
ncbi:hypothetical protein NECID01_0912 [Nematocida sp. AWRm77]|nr:hypothetical protein NECID01_0912 [Nematocida sp. AWRm77]